MGVYVRWTDAFSADGLKGFCYFVNRILFVVINENLDEHEQRLVAMHEAAHIVLHRKQLMVAPLRDFGLFSMRERKISKYSITGQILVSIVICSVIVFSSG